MLARIDREMRRDGITADITAAIETAIHNYEGDRFLFNEAEASATLTTGNNTIALPSDFIEVDTFQAKQGGTRYDLKPLNENEMDTLDPGNTTGAPTYFVIYRDQIRFDKAADQQYPLKMAYQKKLTEVSASASSAATNAWMTDGEEMIRSKAKAILFRDRLRNPEMAAAMDQAAQSARLRLRQKSIKLVATGTIQKRQF